MIRLRTSYVTEPMKPIMTDCNQQLREKFEWYEEELDRYDSDYDDLMAEVDKLRNDNRRYRMRGSRDDRPGKEEMEREQKEDIKDDGEELSFDDLWKKAEKED